MDAKREPVTGMQPPARILLVEDDEPTARVLIDNLALEGFIVARAGTAAEAVRAAAASYPDLVLLDVMLPDATGFDVSAALRRGGAAALILLTARGQKDDKLRGLSLGADDYVTKPFDMDELLARIRAVLRRSRGAVHGLTLGAASVDLQSQRVTWPQRESTLTRREAEILRYLAERKDRVVERDELLREVWGYQDVPMTRSVDSAVARLRKKIEADPHHPQFLHTVHGNGYCLTSVARTDAPAAGAPPAAS